MSSNYRDDAVWACNVKGDVASLWIQVFVDIDRQVTIVFQTNFQFHQVSLQTVTIILLISDQSVCKYEY